MIYFFSLLKKLLVFFLGFSNSIFSFIFKLVPIYFHSKMIGLLNASVIPYSTLHAPSSSGYSTLGLLAWFASLSSTRDSCSTLAKVFLVLTQSLSELNWIELIDRPFILSGWMVILVFARWWLGFNDVCFAINSFYTIICVEESSSGRRVEPTLDAVRFCIMYQKHSQNSTAFGYSEEITLN